MHHWCTITSRKIQTILWRLFEEKNMCCRQNTHRTRIQIKNKKIRWSSHCSLLNTTSLLLLDTTPRLRCIFRGSLSVLIYLELTVDDGCETCLTVFRTSGTPDSGWSNPPFLQSNNTNIKVTTMNCYLHRSKKTMGCENSNTHSLSEKYELGGYENKTSYYGRPGPKIRFWILTRNQGFVID
jgi:hypothetical protein